MLCSVVIEPAIFRATHRFQSKTTESFIFVVSVFSGSVAT